MATLRLEAHFLHPPRRLTEPSTWKKCLGSCDRVSRGRRVPALYSNTRGFTIGDPSAGSLICSVGRPPAPAFPLPLFPRQESRYPQHIRDTQPVVMLASIARTEARSPTLRHLFRQTKTPLVCAPSFIPPYLRRIRRTPRTELQLLRDRADTEFIAESNGIDGSSKQTEQQLTPRGLC